MKARGNRTLFSLGVSLAVGIILAGGLPGSHAQAVCGAKVCVGGSNAGTSCAADADCTGGGVCRTTDLTCETCLTPAGAVLRDPDQLCAGGSKAGAFCSANTDCPGGTCINGPLPPAHYCLMSGNIGAHKFLEMDDVFNNIPFPGAGRSSVADANLTPGNTANDPDYPPSPVCNGGARNGLFCLTIADCPGGTCVVPTPDPLDVYLDWQSPELGITTIGLGSVENHHISDFVGGTTDDILQTGKDCVVFGSTGSSKYDFSQTYVANNNTYMYFGQERLDVNGNTVYYMLLTHKPPIVQSGNFCRGSANAGSACSNNSDCPGGSCAKCGGNTLGQLQFDLTNGDIELAVGFPSTSDLGAGGVFSRFFHKKCVGGPTPGVFCTTDANCGVGGLCTGASATGYISPTDAVFHPGWVGGFTTPVLNFALNLVPATLDPPVAPDAGGDDAVPPWGIFGAAGNLITTGNYAETAFAEWAVPLSGIFGQGVSACGQELYLTGVSRASTGSLSNLNEPSDLKDIVGPKLYSFGGLKATAAAADVGCTRKFTYHVDVRDANGTLLDRTALTGLQFAWSCKSHICSAGSGLATDKDCSTDSDCNGGTCVEVLSSLKKLVCSGGSSDGLSCSTNSDCPGGGACVEATPPDGPNGIGEIPVSDNNPHKVDCHVDVTDPASSCGTAADAPQIVVTSPIKIDITPFGEIEQTCPSPLDSCGVTACSDPPATCEANFDNGITFPAVVVGGSGTYTYKWFLRDENNLVAPNDSGACPPESAGFTSTDSCTVHVPDSLSCATWTVNVTVRDVGGKCSDVSREPSHIRKRTRVRGSFH